MRVFVLTFAFNESFFLPRWVAYYGSQVGDKNLFILDHGSSDLSTEHLGAANIVKVPRSSYDEVKRVDFATQFHAGLLNYFDAGFVVDSDEFLVAEPLKYKNLEEFAELTKMDAPACVGLELFHIRALEGSFSESLPILTQRRHVLFDSWMCKRSFSRKAIRFGGGFHTSDQPVIFDEDLFLIHLKNFDYNQRLVRQATTSQWLYAGDFGEHAKRPAEYVKAVFNSVDAKIAQGRISHDLVFRTEIDLCIGRSVLNRSGEYDFNLKGGFQGSRVHVLPSRFGDLF